MPDALRQPQQQPQPPTALPAPGPATTTPLGPSAFTSHPYFCPKAPFSRIPVTNRPTRAGAEHGTRSTEPGRAEQRREGGGSSRQPAVPVMAAEVRPRLSAAAAVEAVAAAAAVVADAAAAGGAGGGRSPAAGQGFSAFLRTTLACSFLLGVC